MQAQLGDPSNLQPTPPRQLYLSHFYATWEAAIWYGTKLGQVASNPQEKLLLSITLYWSYVSNLNSDFDGLKSKVGLIH